MNRPVFCWVSRSSVDGASQHSEVRDRYERRCGYCGVSEVEAGGQLTIDHFKPLASGGDESPENLVYACFRCNSYKGDFFQMQKTRKSDAAFFTRSLTAP